MSINRVDSNFYNITTTSIGTTNIGERLIEYPYYFKDGFNFSEIDVLQDGRDSDVVSEELALLLFNIFRDALLDRIIIEIRLPLTNQQSIIEAMFKPPSGNRRARIYVPLRGFYSQIDGFDKSYLMEVIKKVSMLSSNKEIIKLIILTSHEYGHFKSYQRGLHDLKLKKGLYVLHSGSKAKNSGEYAYFVFSEEAIAWRLAKDILTKYNFTDWVLFQKIKISSMREYYRVLGFDSCNVSISTLCKISMMEDYELFNTKSIGTIYR